MLDNTYFQEQHLIRLEKDGIHYWGWCNYRTNLAEVYYPDGKIHETLSLSDINGWVNPLIFRDNGYNLCEIY